MNKVKLLYIYAIFLSLALSCSNKDTAGTSLETQNSIAFQVVYPDGNGVKGCNARVRPLWFVADSTNAEDTNGSHLNLVADKNGWIKFDSLPEGYYVIESFTDNMSAIKEFYVGSITTKSVEGIIQLEKFGSISGQINLNPEQRFAWIQIYGLDRKTKTDSVGYFRLDSLPSSALRIRAIAEGSSSILGEEIIQVRSEVLTNIGEVVLPQIEDEDVATWKYNREISLAGSISSWMPPMTSPTVLNLHLSDSLIPFSEVLPNGSDLRVRSKKGRLLPFQLSYWDPASHDGLIRIRIEDGDLGADSTVLLYWGRSEAINRSDSLIWEGVDASLMEELYTLFVEDFEDTSSQTSLKEPIKPSYWYLVTSDSAAIITPPLSAGYSASIQPAGEGRSGNAFHIANSSSDNHYLLIGTALESAPHNFSALDSVVFWAKGSGEFSFSLDNLLEGGGKAWKHDSLPSEWTRKCIRRQDWLPADGISANVGWEAVKDSITNITIFVWAGADFWIDDIRFYGLNRDDLK